MPEETERVNRLAFNSNFHSSQNAQTRINSSGQISYISAEYWESINRFTRCFDGLQRRKIIPEWLSLNCEIGITRIILGEGPFYDEHECGKWALTLPVVHGSRVIDLVAWPLNAPREFRVRRGEFPYLGHITDTVFPIEIHNTPLGWMKSGCVGICPLNLEQTARHLKNYDRIVIEDDDLILDQDRGYGT